MVVERAKRDIGSVKKGERLVRVKRYWHKGYWVEESTRATPKGSTYPRRTPKKKMSDKDPTNSK